MQKQFILKCLTAIILVLLGLIGTYFFIGSIFFVLGIKPNPSNSLVMGIQGSIIFFSVTLPLLRKGLGKIMADDPSAASCLNILFVLFLLSMGAGVIFFGMEALSLILFFISFIITILNLFAYFIPFPIILIILILILLAWIATMKEDKKPSEPNSSHSQAVSFISFALIVTGLLLFFYNPKIWELIYSMQTSIIMGFSGFMPDRVFNPSSFYESNLWTFYKPVLLFFGGITKPGIVSLLSIFGGLILYLLYSHKVTKSLMVLSGFLLPLYIAMISKNYRFLGDISNPLLSNLRISIIILVFSGIGVYYLFLKAGLLNQKKTFIAMALSWGIALLVMLNALFVEAVSSRYIIGIIGVLFIVLGYKYIVDIIIQTWEIQNGKD